MTRCYTDYNVAREKFTPLSCVACKQVGPREKERGREREREREKERGDGTDDKTTLVLACVVLVFKALCEVIIDSM